MTMLRALFKITITLMLLIGLSMNASRAEVRMYQYDGKLPFVQMMLNMMVAMGILDQVPLGAYYGNGLYGGGLYGNGLYGRSFGRSWYTNPYMRAMMLRGYNPGMPAPGMYGGLNPNFANSLYGNSFYGNNPFVRSPWATSPWTMGGWSGTDFYDGGLWSGYGLSPLTNVYGANPYSSPVWGTPTWGVLPTNDYAIRDLPADSPWNEDEVDSWSKEPWLDQSDDMTDDPWRSASAYDSPERNQAPIVLNNIITTQPSDQPPGQASPPPMAQSPLARLMRPGTQPANQTTNPSRRHPPSTQEDSRKPKSSPLYKYSQRAGKYIPADPADNRKYGQSNKSTSHSANKGPLCVTPFCGLKKPDLNGLWLANDGEMLGIKDDRYLWTDGNERYLTGQLKIENEYLLAKVEGYDYILRYKYKLANNHLLTLQPDGSLVEFVRVPVDPYPYTDY